MNRREQEELALACMSMNTLAVLSTVNPEQQPEAAAVFFTARNNFQLIFHTFSTYRKYHNLQTNKNIAFVIGWNMDRTIQYEGTVSEPKGQELMDIVALHRERHPSLKQFDGDGSIRYFLVTPKWLRFTDLAITPWLSYELTFPADPKN